MRRHVRFILAAAYALALGLLGIGEARADKLADILQRGTVRIIVFSDVPPFGSINANRELEGFDIDLAKMVAQALGVKLELVQASAANRIPYLLTDRADMNIAAMSVTAERARQVMYSAPYADTSLAVFGPKSLDVRSAADLGKLKVAVAKGTTEDLTLTAAAPGAMILRTEDNATAVQTYLSGQSDLLAANSVVVVELAKKNPNKEFQFKFALRRAPAHITMRMGEHNLLRWVDTFLFQATLSGELDKLHVK
ncbi:MAG TPA: transporter substrate-binding domain-containing protein, partial [Alphaproteobacteria bacterium]|nr:transporter substrate-binding domain-containing protein [Alphaproteobacteria bacterium]